MGVHQEHHHGRGHHPRITKTLRATIERMEAELKAGQNRFVPATLLDASLEGVGVLADEAFTAEAAIRITLHFGWPTEEGSALVAMGTVRTCHPDDGGKFRVGVALLKRSRHDLQIWHDMLQRWLVFVP